MTSYSSLLRPRAVGEPPPGAMRIAQVEAELGYRLPKSYIETIRECNGGYLKRPFFYTAFETTWSSNGFAVRELCGIGGESSIDRRVGGSRYLIDEWTYPRIGVVLFVTPSAEDDAVMLDYREDPSGNQPRVAYIESNYDGTWSVQIVSRCFDEFMDSLTEAPNE